MEVELCHSWLRVEKGWHEKSTMAILMQMCRVCIFCKECGEGGGMLLV